MVQIEGLPSRYTIESLLGEGGFGKVFRVRDSHRGETLALKVISQDSANVRASLMKEFKILTRLQHPNLVRVHDFGYLSSRHFYFTMEYLEGNDLRTFLAERPHLTFLPSVLEQLLGALAYLHRNGIIHGDIKPENIIVVKRNGGFIAKLLDFGLTSSGRASKQITVSGTPRFLAPEIFTSGARKGPATDLYALGASLVESILGEHIAHPSEVAEKDLKRQAARMGTVLTEGGLRNPSILSSFITDLCMPDPAQRTESAEAAARGFETLSLGTERIETTALAHVFVDRVEEINRISVFLRVSRPAKGILLIRGPRGIGKKTLLRKALQGQQLKRRVIIDLGSASYDRLSIPELSRTIASQLGARERTLFSAAERSMNRTAKTLRVAQAKENLESRALVLFDHLVNGLHSISLRMPVVILLPDIDRFGKDYCRFADHIVNFLESTDTNIKLLATVNTDAPLPSMLSQLVEKLTSREYAQHHNLEGFSDEILKRYLHELFGATLLSDREIRNFNESTQGIPLLIEILLRNIIDERVLRIENGEWIFDRAVFARRRASLQGDDAFATEFERLSVHERNTLKLLALIDRGISDDALSAIGEGLIDDIPHATRTLVSRGILRRDSAGAISFGHPLYKAVASNKSSIEDKALFSKAIAEYLSDAEPSDHLRIARFYIAAGNVEFSLRFGLKAADMLFSSYLPYDCLALLVDLKNLVADRGTRDQLHEILIRLAPIEYQTGLMNNALSSYGKLIKWEKDPELKLRHMIQNAALKDNLGDARGSADALRLALKYCEKHALPNYFAEIYYRLGITSQKRAIHYLSKAVNLSGNANLDLKLLSSATLAYRYKVAGKTRMVHNLERDVLAGVSNASDHAQKLIYQYLASVHLHSGNYRMHRYFIEKKMKAEQRKDDTLGLIESLLGLGGSYYVEGNYAALIETLKETASLAARYNQKVTVVNARFNLVLAYRMLGDYGKSLELLSQANKALKDKEIGQISSVAFIKAPQLYAILGRAKQKEFESSSNELLLIAERAKNSISLGHHRLCRSANHQFNVRFRESLDFAEKAIALFTKAEDRDDIVLALVQKAIALASMGRTHEAAKSAAKAIKIYEEIHCEYLKPFLMLGRGMIARLDGESDARTLLMEGLRTSKKMGTREITWQLQRELALYHRDRGEAGRALESYQDAVDTLKQITETLDDEKLRVSYLQVPIRKRVFDEIKELRSEIRRSS